jgi:hypothetical protein
MATVRCRNGHESETPDFCDECGVPIDGPGAPSPGRPASAPGPRSPSSSPSSGDPVPAGEVCPLCGAPRTGRFCEEDGHDFVVAGSSAAPAAPAAPAPAPAAPPAPVATGQEWFVTVDADRRYYETVVAREGPDIAEVSFPTYYPKAEVPLTGAEVRVGRRRVHGTTPAPQVDLAGPPLDPGVSHLHAVLLPLPDDAGWSVLDPGSTNGTTINYGDDPIALDTVIPLADGDRVHVGAFTTLVVARR